MAVNQDSINKYRKQSATMKDLSKNYGFDFSRQNAARQAEAEAQAKRDAVQNNMRQIDSNVRGATQKTDHNFFQQFLGQQQGQANSGLNAGIAQDQNLRLAMSRQNALGDVYRDANVQRMQQQDNLGRVNLERVAREDALHNERTQQAFENRLAEGQLTGNYRSAETQQMVSDLMDLKQQAETKGITRGARNELSSEADRIRRQLALQGIDPSSVGADVSLDKVSNNLSRIGQQQTLDSRRFDESQRQFNLGRQDSNRQFNQQFGEGQRQFDLSRGDSNRQFDQQLMEQKRQFNSEQEWRKHQFNNMSATDRARLESDIAQFGEDLAWRKEELKMRQDHELDVLLSQTGESGFSGGSGGGGSLIGSTVKKYESGNSGPGTIANNRGDIGGASYGTYQIATNTGTMNSFLNHLKSTNPSMHSLLAGKSPGSASFNRAWSALAMKDKKGFEEAQHNFIAKTHYMPVVDRIKKISGIDVSRMNRAVQEAVWSMSIQHGAGGAANVWKNANISKGMSDKNIIDRLYKERAKTHIYFRSSSPAVKRSVADRFKNEREDVLKMLGLR